MNEQVATGALSKDSQWVHKKGNTYTIVMLTNMEGDRDDADFPPTVVYKGEDGRVWSRTIARWFGSFTPVELCLYKK